MLHHRLLKADVEQGGGHRHLVLHVGLSHGGGLVDGIVVGHPLLGGLQQAVAGVHHLVGGDATGHHQAHIVQVIVAIITAVQQFGSDLGDGLHGAGDVHADGVLVEQTLQHIEQHAAVGLVLAHTDLLTDDALLLLHRLLGEVGVLHELQQNLQAGQDILGGVEHIGGAVKGGVGVGAGAGLRKLTEGVALLALEQLVLQVVGDALGHLLHAAVGGGQHVVHRAVFGGEHRVDGGSLGLRPHHDTQAALVGFGIESIT